MIRYLKCLFGFHGWNRTGKRHSWSYQCPFCFLQRYSKRYEQPPQHILVEWLSFD